MSMSYRPEIDGLRSVAVFAVLIFHLEKDWLPGGFLGVDVFFTISGYLITAIILRECEQGSFSLKNFWLRRIKRLFPALVFMVGSVLLAGFFLLIRPERFELPWQATSSLFSFANIYFWRTTGGYWTQSSESNPLLHTWSLSLEEQFYLCFPIILIILRRFGVKAQFTATVILTAASLALSILATPAFRSASFYLLPPRMWELLLGALLAFLHIKTKHTSSRSSSISRFLPDLGLALIIFSFFAIPNDESFPGWKPLLPCAGTLLLLNSNTEKSCPSLTLLSKTFFVFSGKMSYSLYLWHWPIYVFLPFTGHTSVLVKLSLTVLFALISYFFVERPLRYGSPRSTLGWMAIPGFAAIAFSLLATSPVSPLLRNFGNLDTEESLTRGREYEALDQLRRHGEGVFVGNPDHRPLICLYGSSHARVLGEPIRAYSESQHFSFLSLATSNLGITALPRTEVPDANEVNSVRLQIIKDLHPDIVIVAGMWSGEIRRNDFETVLTDSLIKIANFSDKVFVLAQVPMIDVPREYHNDLRKYIISKQFSGASLRVTPHPDVIAANNSVSGAIDRLNRADVIFLDTMSPLLEQTTVRLVEQSRFLYSDYHHVNNDGASLLFEAVLRDAIDTEVTAGPLVKD
ncbi:MAG: hypothetical protein CMO55_25260 [Verrucomicrobiales bacterium]|nr:hypothetical protein [Verrucomicrobiales bacterium]